MTTLYVFKTILAAAVLYGLYRLVLEREKMLQFNRFYLLLSVVASLVIPLLSFNIPLIKTAQIVTPTIEKPLAQIADNQIFSTYSTNQVIVENTIDWGTIGWILYGGVSLILAVRLGKNLWNLWQRIQKNKKVKEGNLNIVLVEENITPYSFGKYAFVSKQSYFNHTIEPQVLAHEQAHILQKHTIDRLLIEMVLVVFWFNPIFWFVKKSILLNHEFLADDWVVKQYQDVAQYQLLLLHNTTTNQALTLSSSFNYQQTKKRFLMMTITTSDRRRQGLQLLCLLLFTTLVFALSDISFAQTPPSPPSPPAMASPEPPAVPEVPAFTEPTPAAATPQAPTSSTKEGVSEAMLKEYRDLVEKYMKRSVRNGKKIKTFHAPSVEDRERLLKIYHSMSPQQQQKQEVTPFDVSTLKPLPKVTPTEKEYEAYKNAKIYGIWIDDKKVPNTALDKYKASDFSQVFVSKLYKNAQATIGYKYKFQVDLMTHSHYKKYLVEKANNKEPRFHFMVWDKR